MRTFFKNNGLSLVLFAIFLIAVSGQYITGWVEYRNDQQAHGRTAVGILQYVGEGHFIEALFENWESEFLQMSAYVIFTVFLYQKGSSESKRPDVEERVNLILPESYKDPNMPWPVRKGGIALKLYKYSLSLALLFLFGVSFVLHAVGGVQEYNSEQLEHGEPIVTTVEYVGTSRFWFESFQNWQSEFLSIGVMVLFTVFLRQQGSPESKPVDSPYSDTGSD